MTNPIGDHKISSSASRDNIDIKVDGIKASAQAVDGAAIFALDITVKIKAKAEERPTGDLSYKVSIPLKNLDEALEVIRSIGDKFKQMTQGELQHHLKHNFSYLNISHKALETSFQPIQEMDKASPKRAYEVKHLEAAQYPLEKKIEEKNQYITKLIQDFDNPQANHSALWKNFLSESSTRQFSREEGGLNTQTKIIHALEKNIQEAIGEKTFDSKALEIAYGAFNEDRSNPYKLDSLLKELANYNELFDLSDDNGCAKIRDYRKEAFLQDMAKPENHIRQYDNPIELLNFYDTAFPGIKEEVFKLNSHAERFSQKQFNAAVSAVLNKEYGEIKTVEDEFKAPLFRQTLTDSNDVFSGKSNTQLLEIVIENTESYDSNDLVRSVVSRNMIVMFSLVPQRDRAVELREKKREEQMQLQADYVKEAIRGIEKIKGVILSAKSQEIEFDRENKEIERIIHILPSKEKFLSKEERFKRYIRQIGGKEVLDLGALFRGEQLFLEKALGITIAGDNFEDFFSNYLKFVSGESDLSKVNNETPMKNVEKII